VDGRVISAVPLNPAQRAAEQQDIATAVQFVQIGAQSFPEEWRIAVDGTQTLEAISQKMRVRALIKFRPDDQKAAMVQQIAQMGQVQQAGGGKLPATQAGGQPGPV